jgi:hypothetical protein
LRLWSNVAKQPCSPAEKHTLLERRVAAIEQALGTLHGLRSAMDDAAAGGGDARVVQWTIERLAAVLLTMLQLQRETGAASDGGVKSLYASALKVAKGGDAKAVLAVLDDVPLVVRNFQAKGKSVLRP